jgi:hypothetical protein
MKASGNGRGSAYDLIERAGTPLSVWRRHMERAGPGRSSRPPSCCLTAICGAIEPPKPSHPQEDRNVHTIF